MAVKRIGLTNFRSYESAAFELSAGATLVVGPNASGKTNLLESVYALATTKSFRAGDRALVRHGEEFYRIVARVGGGADDEKEYALAYSMAGGAQEKRAFTDGLKRSLSAHIGEMQIVLFEPTHLAMVTGPPEGRRRYLDFILCQTDRKYMKTLQAYKRALKQRNALLEGPGGGYSGGDWAETRNQLFVWNIKLAELATDIVVARRLLIGALNGLLSSAYGEIADGAGRGGEQRAVNVEYLPSVNGEYADEFLAALERNAARDMAAGFTMIGPHREDFRVSFDGSEVGAVASRGEVRTVVLALKLAEMDYVREMTGRAPLLLLDDVFSELDHDRRAGLIRRLEGSQSIITTTDADAVTPDISGEYSVLRMGGDR